MAVRLFVLEEQRLSTELPKVMSDRQQAVKGALVKIMSVVDRPV